MHIWPPSRRKMGRSRRSDQAPVRGRILFSGSQLSLYVKITSHTDCGATIQQMCLSKLPEYFLLEAHYPKRLLPERHHCLLRWQKGYLLGVEFLEPEAGRVHQAKITRNLPPYSLPANEAGKTYHLRTNLFITHSALSPPSLPPD